MSTPLVAGWTGDLSSFPFTRRSLQWLLDFRPPEHIGLSFSDQSRLADLSLDGAVAVAGAAEVFRKRILRAVRTVVEDFENGGGIAPAPEGLGTEWLSLSPSRLTVQFRAEVGVKQAQSLVDKAIANLGLVSSSDIVVRRGARAGVPVIQVTVDRAAIRFAETQSGFMGLLEAHAKVPYLRDGLLACPDGRYFDAVPGILDLLPAPTAKAVLKSSHGSELGRVDRRLAALPYSQDLSRTSDEQREELVSQIPGVLRALADLSLEHFFETGLWIMEAWHRQRDAWARRQLEPMDECVVSTGKTSWLEIEPSALYARLCPGRPKPRNWRKRTFQILQAMAAFEECEPPKGTMIVRRRGLLSAAVDGRLLDRAAFGRSSELATALRAARIGASNHFFVAIDPAWTKTFLPYRVFDGEVHWSKDATGPVKEHSKVNGHVQYASGNAYKAELKANNYFNVDPAVVLAAILAGCSKAQTRLLLAVLAQVSPRQPAVKTGKGRSRSGAGTGEPGNETGDLVAGGKRSGYRIAEWLKKGAYNTTGGEPSPAMFRAFLNDVKALNEVLGLTIEATDHEADTHELLERFSFLSRRRRGWKNTILKFWLPKDRGAAARESLRLACIEDSGNVANKHAKELLGEGARLLEDRRRRKLTQSDVAEACGVSKIMVSHWESGRRTIAEHHKDALAELLSPDVARVEFALTSRL